MPTQKFHIGSRSSGDYHTAYLAFHMVPRYHSVAPFQQYYRLSGLRSKNFQHMAIDIDLGRAAWRVLSLNNQDPVNAFLAGRYESEDEYNRNVPEFEPVSQNDIRNGTFSEVSPILKHMDVPELDLRIANMYDFINSYEQEPFLRVFRMWNSISENTSIADTLWSSEDDEHIVMRTASFGHGRQRLDMCIKEEDDGTMEDDLYVPMAIIAAHRLRLWEAGSRSFSC